MEEAPVAVTAATGALGSVVAKLSTLLQRHGEYKLRRGTRKDIKLIRSKLKSIHSILWVIWEREDLDAAGKELRMEAWRLADDMSDAIDDFILTMKRSNDGKRFMQTKNQPSPFQDLKRRADDVWERCRKKWKKMTASHTTVSSLFSRTRATVDDSGPAKPFVHKDFSELVGMEEPRDTLIKHLVGEEESTPQLKMACIVGAAGMGKTTLARLVYEEIKDKFEARAFVSVTLCRNMTEVLASILQQVVVDNTAVLLAGTKAATEKHLIGIISNFLRDKRYLVIIDDIWHYGEWKSITKSLPNNNVHSRILTTSRVYAITETWRDDFTAFVYQIDHLDYNVLNEMIVKLRKDKDKGFNFNHSIGLNDNDMVAKLLQDRERFDYDHSIVGMCDYMPLAVACMSSAMTKEGERQQQQGLPVETPRGLQNRIEEQVKRSGIQNTPGFEPLVESLELGYSHLPHHMLKTCLLYCSIYPEGHSFRRGDLVRRWIAEGFVSKEEAAKEYFDELVSKGLIREDVNRGLIQKDGDHYKVIEYKMHPMMRNYLRQKLQEDDFITCSCNGVPSSVVSRLCIDYWPSSDAVDPLPGIDWHHIRSLVVFKEAKRVPYGRLQQLRVLAVQPEEYVWGVQPNSRALEDQHLKDICGLLRLRHLLVSGGGEGITEIPTEIARLQYLETLEVTGTKITTLPAEMGDLKQLKTLDVSHNNWLAELPREIGNLQHLETLRFSRANIREQPWEIIGALKKLKTLHMSGNEFAGLPRNIGELQHLKDLDVSSNKGITELPKEIGKLQHLESLDVSRTAITELTPEIGKLKHLKTLNMSGTGITDLPNEIGDLQQLEALYLREVKTIKKLTRDIGKLKALETLDLNLTDVRKIPREIGGTKKLKNLRVDDIEGTVLPFEAGQLSKLVGVPMWVRQAWKKSDRLSLLRREILSFEHYNTGGGGLILGTKHIHIPYWIKDHFNNVKSLHIRICKLEEQDLKILREMPYLENLTLTFEAVPREPIAISRGGFAKLLGLVVDSRVPRLTFQEGAMPSLFGLTFVFQFYSGPPNTDPPLMGIKHLVNLHKVSFRCNEWYRADSPCISATIDIMRKEAREHPNMIVFAVPGKDNEHFPENSITQSSQDGNEACSSSGSQEIEEIQA